MKAGEVLTCGETPQEVFGQFRGIRSRHDRRQLEVRGAEVSKQT